METKNKNIQSVCENMWKCQINNQKLHARGFVDVGQFENGGSTAQNDMEKGEMSKSH